LSRLHTTLYSVLAEFIRVCDLLGTPYFLIGGSAIGARHRQGIVACDDDIDVGMCRDDYKRFLEEAPGVVSPDFFLSHYGVEPGFPFTFAKLRKNGTYIEEEFTKGIEMNKGIFVDIFPFDKIPDNGWLEKIQRYLARKCHLLFLWKQSGIKPDNILLRPFLILPASLLFRLHHFFSNAFNKTACSRVNNVFTSFDQLDIESIKKLSVVPFGPLMVKIPDNVDKYLHHHYPEMNPEILESQWISHAADFLDFGGE